MNLQNARCVEKAGEVLGRRKDTSRTVWKDLLHGCKSCGLYGKPKAWDRLASRFYDAMATTVLNLSDSEIVHDVIADGDDPVVVARRMRKSLDALLMEHGITPVAVVDRFTGTKTNRKPKRPK